MLSLFQLRIRDLLWFMLVCALIALFIRRHDRTVFIDSVLRTEIYTVDEFGVQSLDDVQYQIDIRDLRLNYGTASLPPLTKQRLDRIAERTSPQFMHLAPPPSPAAPPPDQSAP